MQFQQNICPHGVMVGAFTESKHNLYINNKITHNFFVNFRFFQNYQITQLYFIKSVWLAKYLQKTL
jgi:hypothetical protein